MSSEVTSGEQDESGNSPSGERDDRTEDSLLSVYRRYIGEPESRQDVYVGFGLFFGGIALGIVGLALFVYSGTQPTGSDLFWQFREIALVGAMLALPAIAMSVAVLLPVGQRTMAASLVGAGIGLVATVWLTQVYPYEWTATGNDVRVIGTYSAGLVVLAASTGSALVAQYVDRVAPLDSAGETAADSTATESEGVSDEQVERDIEEAMEDSALTWGGVDQQPTTKRLKLDMPDTASDLDRSNFGDVPATETRSTSENVDDAVAGLRQLQGGDQKTARAKSPDDQVTALTEFRERQEQDQELETGVETDRGILARLREKLFG